MTDFKHHPSCNKEFTKLFKEIWRYFVKSNWGMEWGDKQKVIQFL